MSLKDDLLRNRKVFELLTVADAVGADSGTAFRKSAPASETFAFETQEGGRQSVPPQEDGLQKAETFSLGFGNRISRETGMALSPVSIERIEFPKLKEAAVPPVSDPLESLYHQLATEARRTSQLPGEEEF